MSVSSVRRPLKNRRYLSKKKDVWPQFPSNRIFILHFVIYLYLDSYIGLSSSWPREYDINIVRKKKPESHKNKHDIV